MFLSKWAVWSNKKSRFTKEEESGLLGELETISKASLLGDILFLEVYQKILYTWVVMTVLSPLIPFRQAWNDLIITKDNLNNIK